jgi:hypothetical protein
VAGLVTAFDASDDAVAHVLARYASIAVAHARKEASLLQAMDTHKLIGHAQGILTERSRLDSEGTQTAQLKQRDGRQRAASE